MKKIKHKKLIITLAIILVVAGLIGYGLYALLSYSKPVGVGLFYTESETVEVHFEDHYYFFDNKENEDDTAIIFYPGAQIDAMAYGPLMRYLAEKGYDVYVMIMPLHYAFLGINRADEIVNNTSYDRYVMMGHSLGGAMAGEYTYKHQDKIDSIIFLAAYTTKDISNSNINVLSIYGSEDGVLNKKSYKKYLKNLPSDYTEYIIEGGNHAQFGSYGTQKGDNDATIDTLEQATITANVVDEFLISTKK